MEGNFPSVDPHPDPSQPLWDGLEKWWNNLVGAALVVAATWWLLRLTWPVWIPIPFFVAMRFPLSRLRPFVPDDGFSRVLRGLYRLTQVLLIGSIAFWVLHLLVIAYDNWAS